MEKTRKKRAHKSTYEHMGSSKMNKNARGNPFTFTKTKGKIKLIANEAHDKKMSDLTSKIRESQLQQRKKKRKNRYEEQKIKLNA